MSNIGDIKTARELGRLPLGRKFIWLACPICDKERWVWLYHQQPAYFLCRRCVSKGRIISEATRLKLSMAHKGKQCSESMKAQLRFIHLGKRRTMEERQKQGDTRKGKYVGEKAGNWRGGPIERHCQECGFIFFVDASQLKHGGGKFCSYRCRTIHQRKTAIIFPTKPETEVLHILETENLPFRYTGDGSFWIEGKNPDFVNINGDKKIIEVFGDYWHDIFDVAERVYYFAGFGFKTLIIWESELRNIDAVQRKIKKFARQR